MKPKPYFKDRSAVVTTSKWDGKKTVSTSYNVRVTDARRPSALRVMENVLTFCYQNHYSQQEVERLAEKADMAAKITNGKVTCKWRLK